MNIRMTWLATLAVSALATQALAATTVTVGGKGDLYLAGAPDGTGCCVGDSAPAESPTLVSLALVSGETLTFSASGGATYYSTEGVPGPDFPTADGQTAFSYGLTADYGTGISGPNDVYLAGLAGVFLGPTQPSGPAPAQLDGTAFASLAPGLDQIFFIGDGLTGTGTGDVQQFTVPVGATRLFLGVVDNGGYYDNSGSITATITGSIASAAPEPSIWALMIMGVGVVGAFARRDRRTAVAAA